MLEGWLLSDKIILPSKVNIHKTVQFPKRSCQRLSQYFVCVASRIISWSDSSNLVLMLALLDTSQFFQLVFKLMGTTDSTHIHTKGFGGPPVWFCRRAGSRGRAHQPGRCSSPARAEIFVSFGFYSAYRLNLLSTKVLVALSERQRDISMLLFYQFKQDSLKKLTFSQ